MMSLKIKFTVFTICLCHLYVITSCAVIKEKAGSATTLGKLVELPLKYGALGNITQRAHDKNLYCY